MSKRVDSTFGVNWADSDRQHQIRIALDMTPAERLRWLEDTVEELQPWVGLARKRGESRPPSTGE